MQPRIYVYKITFKDMPFWYWGAHKEKVYGETYLGSPTTNKWYWGTYEPRLQILELFPYTEQGWRDAGALESRLIMPDLNNPLCLNECCAGVISLECLRKGGIKGGKNVSKKHQTERGKRGGARAAELRAGVCSLDYMQSEKYIKDRVKGGKIGGVTGGSNTGNQEWESTVDGFRGNPGNVAQHNKANGWDPNARVKAG
jgi:hypothetical protein